ACARGPARLPHPERARESRARLVPARRTRAAGRRPADGARTVSDLEGAREPAGRVALRRRAADAGPRPRAHGPAGSAAARRAIPGAPPPPPPADLPHDPPAP